MKIEKVQGYGTGGPKQHLSGYQRILAYAARLPCVYQERLAYTTRVPA